ncbi:MAG TPA: FHA domain-containing protein [Myxococcales bacterium]|nr:FHA domain-containing protein [Myxococcales bacterium]HIN86157.1 FHA domain-containing protein [Myxococcales bacterium]
MNFILDFFKRLVRYRVAGAKMKVREKIYSAQTRAKSKASSKFNAAIDKPINKLKGNAKAAANKHKPGKKAGGTKSNAPHPGKREEKVGLFGKKNRGGGGTPPIEHDEEFEPGGKTQAIDVSNIVDDRSQDVVGWIVCLNGSQRGRDFRLVTGRNVIGTAADCDIVLTDPYLSSKHVVIRHENGEFMLIDLDSTNGSNVNDRPVTKQELIDNDKVRIGRTEMKFKSLF